MSERKVQGIPSIYCRCDWHDAGCARPPKASPPHRHHATTTPPLCSDVVYLHAEGVGKVVGQLGLCVAVLTQHTCWLPDTLSVGQIVRQAIM
jgi:hypothetical protein